MNCSGKGKQSTLKPKENNHFSLQNLYFTQKQYLNFNLYVIHKWAWASPEINKILLKKRIVPIAFSPSSNKRPELFGRETVQILQILQISFQYEAGIIL